MSLIVSVYVPTGIVISGDSRTTLTLPQVPIPGTSVPAGPALLQNNVIASDSTRKAFIIFDRFGIGTYGQAFADNMPIAHSIEQFELRNQANPPQNTQQAANALLAYFRSLSQIPSTSFIMSSYDALEPWVVIIDVANNS